MEKPWYSPNSNFKEIPLNSELWKDSSFDEVSIVIIYGDEVYVGTWESLENISINFLIEMNLLNLFHMVTRAK